MPTESTTLVRKPWQIPLAQAVIFIQLFIIVVLVVFQTWQGPSVNGFVAGMGLIAVLLFAAVCASAGLTFHANNVAKRQESAFPDATLQARDEPVAVDGLAQFAPVVHREISQSYYALMLQALEDTARTFCCEFSRDGDGKPPLVTLHEEDKLARAVMEARLRYMRPNTSLKDLVRLTESSLKNGEALRWLDDLLKALSSAGVKLVAAPGREAICLGLATHVKPPQPSSEDLEHLNEELEQLAASVHDHLSGGLNQSIDDGETSPEQVQASQQ